MYIDNKLLSVALGSLLVGGGAVAAYHSLSRPDAPAGQPTLARAGVPKPQPTPEVAPLELRTGPDVSYAPIVSVKPVTRSAPQYASVIGIDPVTRAGEQQRSREVCDDVPVTKRLPERDGNVGGTVAGAVIGGLVGNQLGKNKGGDRRKIETAAGAVGGAFLGRYIDQRHVGGQVVQATERQCRTVTESVPSNRVVGYDVTFRNPDGSTGMKRMDKRPGSRIALGSKSVTESYDVTYELDGRKRVVRMDRRPGVDRFKVVDGEVITRI
ncbi:glycine zipper 2TM domain-containing protein [Lysobacter pythonis]|uniref:Glycine zipper 2TM domain-containing protein n=2 Tax=Solilutibacter pythonis TaxID=2483112 RepID=A0A3M2I993_9GAMM|nr:glycine zipper 2TM domain-containing protein [Lysobacter pythonis]RMH94874.1 glycine zipper 2TM domain-containing protein [Lysobacter pythonis]